MAKPETLPNRKHYACSGQVNWSMAPAFLLLNFIGCLLGGWLMAFLFRHGFYFIGVVSAIFGLGASGLVILTIKRAHCRSRLLGALLGGGLGLAMFLGYYYFDFCNQLGGVAPLTDLPAYIWKFRLQYDSIQDTHSSDRKEDHQPGTGRFIANSAVFLLELGILAGLPLVAGYRRAGKPYCEHCRQWTDREVTRFDPAQTNALLETLRSGSPTALAALCATADFATVPNLSLALDACPTLKKDTRQPCAAFLSLKKVEQNPQGANFDAFDSAKGTVLVSYSPVKPEELPALAGRFACLKSSAAGTIAPTLPPVLPAAASAAPAPPTAYVEVKALPAEFSGRILTLRNRWISAIISLSVVAGILGSVALTVGGGSLWFSPKYTNPLVHALGAVMLVMGVLLCVGLVIINFANPALLSYRWFERIVRRELKSRPANLVNPTLPENRYVCIIPKPNWAKMMLEDATEMGLLAIDRQRGLVLFEGDHECFRIPAQAITSCVVEVHVQQNGHQQTAHYYAVLRAQHPNGFWEAPIKLRTGKGLFSSGARKRATEELVKDINSLRDPATLPVGHLGAQIGYIAG